MISPKPTINAFKSSALLSNTSGRTRSRPLFDKRSLSTLAHSPSALLPSATAISARLRPRLQENSFHLKDRQGARAYTSVKATNCAQYHDAICVCSCREPPEPTDHFTKQTLPTTMTVDSPILSSLGESTHGRSLDPTYYNVAYGNSTLSAIHDSEPPSPTIDTGHVDPSEVIDILQLLEATLPQFQLPAAFYEIDTYPNVDASEYLLGSPTEDDVSACNAETLLDFMLQPLEESELFSMPPEMSPETTQLSDAAASYDAEVYRIDSDLALEQLQQLSLSTTTHSPDQSTKRKRDSSACDSEEETRMKRSRALSEDNYDFPDEIPNIPPSPPNVFSHVSTECKRPLPFSEEDDDISTPSPKRLRSESDHEYDFLAEALLSSTPPCSPPINPPSCAGLDPEPFDLNGHQDHEYDFLAEAFLSSTPPYSPPTESQLIAGLDSTVSDMVNHQGSEYDVSVPRLVMSAPDLATSYEAGAYLCPSGFVVSPPSVSGLLDLPSLSVLHHSNALPTFSVYREAGPVIWNEHDILSVYPARNFDECLNEVLDKNDDDYIVTILAIAFSSKLRLEYCSVCRATMAPLCRCKLDTEIGSLCTNCDSLLLPYCTCLAYMVHTLPRPRKGMGPPHCSPYLRADRTLWHAPFLPVMDVDSGLSVKEIGMLDLSVHNTTIDSDIRRRRRKAWRSWKFGWIGQMIGQSRSLEPIPGL